MNSLLRLFRYEGYEVIDVQVSVRDERVVIVLDRKDDKGFFCSSCRIPLGKYRGRHRFSVKEMSIMGYSTEIRLWRHKGYCPKCQKARSEEISFIPRQHARVTKAYDEFVGHMCEFAPVSRVAKFTGNSETRTRTIDYERMRRYLRTYKIPPVTHITVDEVYARKKSRYKNESRDKKFFTVITDLKTRKVIWVSESREKAALDEFFNIIGKKACHDIQVVAIDQYDGYKRSVKDNCPNATVVWDRFHLMQTFNEALNEERKTLHNSFPRGSDIQELTRGKYRFIFLKKPDRRTKDDQSHIDQVFLENAKFSQLEIIKERFYSFFDQRSEISALDVFCEIGRWIDQTDFQMMRRWYRHLERNWDTVKNYFTFKVSSALAEGTNNVIKALKRRAFGYVNMDYFRLKIMQVCGYLNSEWAGKQVVT